MRNLLSRYREWRRKRKWNAALQLHHLRITMEQDARWLAHDPIASELTRRYLRMLSDRWESEHVEPVDHLRRRLGLDPWVKP